MPATIAWNGFGRVSAVDTLTGVTALKISGSGGGPSAAVADGQIQGSGAATCVCSRQRVALYYDIGAGNELDFSTGGAQEGQMIHVWGNFLAAALLNVQSAGGFGIFLASSAPSTSNYHLYYFFGSDNYAGGWRRMIIDPTKPTSSSSGTLNLAAVRYIGVFGDVGGTTARFDNLILDAIDVGYGLLVTGTSTTDALFADLISDEANNRFGITKALNNSESAVELGGQLELGDNTGTASSTLTDINSKIFLAEPTYYDGTSVEPSVPLGFFKINFVGNGTGTTDITLGKKVGVGDTARGRNGLSIIGNATYDLGIDFDDGNVDALKIYGTTFEKCTGTLSWGTTATHECIGNFFVECEQFDPVGGIEIRTCNFIGYSGANAALLWNANVNIKNCNFIFNADVTNNPAGVEHQSPGTFTYDGLIFSGNDNDVYNNSGGALVINGSNGSNPSDILIRNSSGSSTTINISVTLTFSGLPVNTEVTIVRVSDEVVLYNLENTLANGLAEYTYNVSEANTNVYINFLSQVEEYRLIDNFLLPSTSQNIPVELENDRVYDNP